MAHKSPDPPRTTKSLIIFGVSLLLLHLGFSSNTWRISEEARFLSHQQDSESLVLGRLVKSRQDGVSAAGGLTGAGIPNDIHRDWITSEQVSDQYAAYLDGSRFDDYSPYLSQTGGQGMLLSLLDRILPLPPPETLELFHSLTSLLSAAAFRLIVVWFYLEFGLLTSGVVLSSVVFSLWLTLFGRNLFWSTWAYFVPMIGMMYYSRHADASGRMGRHHVLGLLGFLLISIKCFINGYEFVTTTLIMMMVPLAYHDLKRKASLLELAKRSASFLAGGLAAIAVNLFVLSLQIAHALQGSLSDGWRHILYSLGKRTYGIGDDYSETVAASLEASVLDVLRTYLTGVYVDTTHFVEAFRLYRLSFVLEREIEYWQLIVLFALGSGYVVLSTRAASAEGRQSRLALVVATWMSIAAPLSWYVIFKGHSYIHTHMNYILWQMPFTLFGFAVVGLAMKCIWENVLTLVSTR